MFRGMLEAFITEVNVKPGVKPPENLKLIDRMHLSMYESNKQEFADRVAKLICELTGAKLEVPVQPYLSSVLEWTFVTDKFDVNIGIEVM